MENLALLSSFTRARSLKKFRCNKCAKRYTGYGHLQNHLQSYTLQCPHCKHHFGTLERLEKHRLSHINKETFFCAQCERSYSDKYRLRHLQTMTFQCHLCTKHFGTEHKLYTHHLHTHYNPPISIPIFQCVDCKMMSSGKQPPPPPPVDPIACEEPESSLPTCACEMIVQVGTQLQSQPLRVNT